MLYILCYDFFTDFEFFPSVNFPRRGKFLFNSVSTKRRKKTVTLCEYHWCKNRLDGALHYDVTVKHGKITTLYNSNSERSALEHQIWSCSSCFIAPNPDRVLHSPFGCQLQGCRGYFLHPSSLSEKWSTDGVKIECFVRACSTDQQTFG